MIPAELARDIRERYTKENQYRTHYDGCYKSSSHWACMTLLLLDTLEEYGGIGPEPEDEPEIPTQNWGQGTPDYDEPGWA